MEKLVKKLNKAAKAYYSEGKSIMSDQEYDALYDQLVQLEKNTGVILPDSPTLRVGYEVVSKLKKVMHKYPALSLNKTKSEEELKEWLGNQEGILSYKMDGLTGVAVYRNDSNNLNQASLYSLVTRGNGSCGEDVTHNSKYIANLPQVLPIKLAEGQEFIVRGEIIISYKDFEKINEMSDEKYMNPRNLASSSVRLMDSYIASQRHMQFIAFEAVSCKNETLNMKTLHETFEYLDKLGFKVVDYLKVSKMDLQQAMNKMLPDLIDLPVDGLVLEYDDILFGKSLGTTKKFPKNAIAFKWKDEAQTTILRSIEWSASRTGLINPIALFDPVEIEGTIVQRASLCNITEMERLGIGDNDKTKLDIIKANMIIPKCIHADGDGKFDIPEFCPVCGCKTIIKNGKDGDTKSLYCVNPNCAAKHIGKFTRLVERDGLNVKGVSEAVIESLVDHGYLKQPADIFHLENYKDDIIKMDGFGERSYNNMISAIDKARSTTFRQFFYALGIPGTGHDVGKILENHIEAPYDLSLLRLATTMNARETLISLNGIGDVIADSIIEWFRSNMTEYRMLCKELKIEVDNTQYSKDLAGKTFVITGKLNSYVNRDALKKEIEDRGGKVSGSVSKNTDYLINNDKASTSGKNKKAAELNIPVISEEEYQNL